MKEWFILIFSVGLFGVVARLLLPQGEKSKLYPPIRFLFSLILTASLFSPVLQFFHRGDNSLNDFLRSFEKADTEAMERCLLERSARTMTEQIRENFPDAKFTLYVYTDENGIPTEIHVSSEGGEGAEIADFIEKSYLIPSEEYEKGGDENGKAT